MRLVQADYDDLLEIATGNVFASTGDVEDGDFANYGGDGIDYWYYSGDADQIPDDFEGLSITSDGPPNSCSNQHCLTPCSIVIADERAIYLAAKETYLHALSQEAWDTAGAAKSIMDISSLRGVQFYLQDTLTYNEDSLLNWYKRMFTPAGYILGSKLKAAQGNFTSASTFLGLAASTFDLTPVEEADLVDLQDIYDILSVRSIENLTGTDLDDLEVISAHPGHASAMARGILSHYGYHFQPEYYVPEEEEFFQAPPPIQSHAAESHYHIFPNPSDGSQINVVVPESTTGGMLEIYDGLGRKVLSEPLFPGYNSIIGDIRIRAPGIYMYRINDHDVTTASGVLLIIGNDR